MIDFNICHPKHKKEIFTFLKYTKCSKIYFRSHFLKYQIHENSCAPFPNPLKKCEMITCFHCYCLNDEI